MPSHNGRTDGFLLALDSPMYSAAEASRLVRMQPARVNRWLKGYEYRYTVSDGHARVHQKEPVIRRERTAGTSYASFLDLVDLLFVKEFLKHGLSLQKVRKALNEAAVILETNHFARETFFTDGRDIFLQVEKDGDAILELLSGGQWVIAPFIRQLGEQIDFHKASGIAQRWYPMGREGLVVLDPFISFGRPTIVGRGTATANVYDVFIAEKESMHLVSSWMDLSKEQVRAAVEFEKQLAA